MSEAKQKERFTKLVQQGENYVLRPKARSPRGVKSWQLACSQWLKEKLPNTRLSGDVLLVPRPKDTDWRKNISSSDVKIVQAVLKIMNRARNLLPLLADQQAQQLPHSENLRKVLSLRFNNKTIAQLCRALGAVVGTHAELQRLFLEYNLFYSDFTGGIDPRCNALVTSLTQRSDADNAITTLIEYVLERGGSDFGPTENLLRALRVDGLEWHDRKLVPTTPKPAELATELSQLELDLKDLGLTVASVHYRQAYESFVAGNSEAANGQIRSFMENLLIEVAKRQTTKTRSNAAAALQDLRDARFFDEPEWQMVRGFWHGIQDKGPHHGLSDEQEALFRLHIATSIARYAMHKSRARSGSS